MKNKVIFVIDSELTFSEAPPSRFIYIAKSLKKKKFKVEVLGRRGEIIGSIRTNQISGSKHFSRLKILLHAYAKILNRHYNAIIVRGGFLGFSLLPLKILGTKIILDFHGWLFREIEVFYEKTLYNKFKVAFYNLVERMSARHSCTIVCVSEGVRDSLGPEEKAKSIVLENGLDINESKIAIVEAEKDREKIYSNYLIPKKKSLIGFLGNWERQLDMETMFKGVKIAQVDMIVIGEGPKLNEFKKTWNDVRFLGKLPRFEALKIIQLCDATIVPYKKAYVSTSYWSQRKVKDYLSLGKPIIMAEVSERERYLVTNKNVLLYKPGNAEDFAEKVKMLVSDEKTREKMRENNLELARRFDWQALVEKSGLIEKLLEP